MECLEGETLAKRLEKGPLPFEQVLKFGGQIADALDKAHRVVSFTVNLKTSNIMLNFPPARNSSISAWPACNALASGLTLTAAATPVTPMTQEGTILRHLSIYVAGADRGQRTRRPQRHFFVRYRCSMKCSPAIAPFKARAS